MNLFHRLLVLASAGFFIASAQAQNAGTVTNHAFAIGKGAGTTGYSSLLCGSAQLAVGQSAADPICKTITGDVTFSAAGAATLATVNSNVGSFGSATASPTFTVNANGLITAASSNTITPAIGSITGLGTGCATFLATPSSANLRGCLTDEVGTGAAYFVGGALGTPASATLTNATGLPLSGLTTQGAFTFVGNNSSSSATPTAVDIAALTAKASPASTDLVMISDQAASGAWKKVTVSSLASAGSVASLGNLTGAVPLALGQTRLSKSGSNLILLPVGGNYVVVNGTLCTVPDAGVTLAATSLSVGTTYYIYATCSAGAVNAIEASTTVHATSTTAGNKGVEIKSADDTRSLVGMARIIAGPAWADTATQRFVRSWFNDPGIVGKTSQIFALSLAAPATNTEISTSLRVEFLSWTGELVHTSAIGYGYNTVAGNSMILLPGFDGTVEASGSSRFDTFTASVSSSTALSSASEKNDLSEGYHYASGYFTSSGSSGTPNFVVATQVAAKR